MPESKRRVQTTAAQAAAHRDTTQDFDDVTVLFAPPRELLEQSAAPDEEVTAFHAPPHSGGWVAEDEATVAIRTSFTLPDLDPLRPLGSAPGASTRPAPPAARVPAPMPVPPARLPMSVAQPPTPPQAVDVRRAAVSVDIGEAELGAILGPRRAARWLAVVGVLALLLAIFAVARLSP